VARIVDSTGGLGAQATIIGIDLALVNSHKAGSEVAGVLIEMPQKKNTAVASSAQ
jgi:hypothetical protein